MLPPLELINLPPQIAPCEHIAGNVKFVLKALELQQRFISTQGAPLVDITLDLEDGAPIGSEAALRDDFIKILNGEKNLYQRLGVRIHDPRSQHFESDLERIVTAAAHSLAYITIPKITTIREIIWATGLIDHFALQAGSTRPIPLHLLIETPEALECLNELASHPRVETLDLGLMDLISHLGGAIRADTIKSPQQFDHALISKIKSEIALTALRHNKVASHNVSVEFKVPNQAYQDAQRARWDYGFLRMWSIHPAQIPHIIRGMQPTVEELTEARAILQAAEAAAWGPIEHNGRLHDRASYRYYWGLLRMAD